MKRKYVDQDLAAAGLQSLIDVLITSVDVGFRKPESAGYLKLAASLGVRPADIVYVGNEEKDIRGAIASGMPAILVSRDGDVHGWGQVATVSSLAVLPKYYGPAFACYNRLMGLERKR